MTIIPQTRADLINEREALLAQLRETLAKHLKILVQIDKDLAVIEIKFQALNTGVSAEDIDIAKRVVYVRGQCQSAGRRAVVDSAIKALAVGPRAGLLQTGYVGTKDYDRFGDQRFDSDYAFRPRHGHIVFEIGLVQGARKRDLSVEERESAIKVLEAVKSGLDLSEEPKPDGWLGSGVRTSD